MTATPTSQVAPRPARLTRRFHLAAAIAVAALGGAQFALASYAGRFGVLAAVVLAQATLAVAWSQGTRTFGFPGSIVVIGGCAIACDFLLWNGGRARFSDVALPVAGAVLASFVHQIARRHPRPRITSSLAQNLTGAASVAALAMLLLVDELLDEDRHRVALILLAVSATAAASHLLDAVVAAPRVSYDVARGAFGMLVGVAAGAALLVWRLKLGALSDLLLYVMVGSAIGLAAILGSVAMSFVTADRRPSRWSALAMHAAFPLCFAAPVAYVVLLFVLSV